MKYMKKSIFFFALLLCVCLAVPFSTQARNVNGKDLEMEDKQVTVSVHCRTRLGIWDADANDKLNDSEIIWSSSDEGIASVDKDGWVTGKKVGTAVITGTYEGEEFKCDVTVRKNAIKYVKYSKKASKYKKNEMIFKFSGATVDAGGTLTLKGDFINTYGKKVKHIKNVNFRVYYRGVRCAKQTVKKITLNTKAKKSKGITLKFKNVDPKVDLVVGDLTIMYSGGKIK